MAVAIQISSRKQETLPLTWMFWRKRRYIVVLLAFLGFISNYSLRVNLSVALVAMTDDVEEKDMSSDGANEGNEQYYDWNSKEVGLIASSFFWGYIFTQLTGGFFAERFGGNLIFGIGIGVPAVLSLLTPWLGTTVEAMIAIRVVQGLFEGVTFPCIHDVWLYWAPASERSRMASIAYSGMFVGTVIAMSISGTLAHYLGWKSIFYVFGGFGVLWYIVWVIVVRSSPDKDRFISKDELEYIQSTTVSSVEKVDRRIPWKKLLTSKPVYAIIISQTAHNWGSLTMMTQMPGFLADAFDYDLESSAFLSAAPWLIVGISLSVSGYLADMLQNKGMLTTTQVRKYFNCFSMIIQIVCLAMAGFLIHRIWSVVFIVIGLGVGGFPISSYSVNPLDIAPVFASVVLGLSNTIGTLPGMISPALSGHLVQNETLEEWQTIFYIIAGVYGLGCLAYWFWCSGEIQPWAKIDDYDEEKVIAKTNSEEFS